MKRSRVYFFYPLFCCSLSPSKVVSLNFRDTNAPKQTNDKNGYQSDCVRTIPTLLACLSQGLYNFWSVFIRLKVPTHTYLFFLLKTGCLWKMYWVSYDCVPYDLFCYMSELDSAPVLLAIFWLDRQYAFTHIEISGMPFAALSSETVMKTSPQRLKFLHQIEGMFQNFFSMRISMKKSLIGLKKKKKSLFSVFLFYLHVH